jgi:hypothetical protein
VTAIDRVSLEARMRSQGLEPAAWSNLAGERYEEHAHAYDKVVVVAEGSITVGLPGHGVSFILLPGERLDLPAGLAHDAVVGPSGVTCLEARIPTGTLGKHARGRGHRW